MSGPLGPNGDALIGYPGGCSLLCIQKGSEVATPNYRQSLYNTLHLRRPAMHFIYLFFKPSAVSCDAMAQIATHCISITSIDLALHGSKIPDWLLSDSDLTGDGTQRQVVRPDLMMVSITTQHAHALEQRKKRTRNGGMVMMLHTEQEACNIKVTIIEVGYCMETRYHDKHKAKMEQHKKLHDALWNAGYQCDIIPIVLGTTGGVFDSNLSGMRQIGISHDRSLTLIRKLSKHAIDYMQSIIDL